MNKFFFSLILCIYGKRKSYLKLLKSLERQKFKNFEIIIINQNKEKIIIPKKFNISVKVFKSKPGLSVSRNLGIKKSKGLYLAFPDDDCEYFPDTLLMVYNTISKKILDVVCGRTVNKKKINTLLNFPSRAKYFSKLDLIRSLNSVTFFIKKKKITFNKELGLSKNKVKSGEETDFILRYFSRYRPEVYYSPKICVFHNDFKFSSKDLNSRKKIIGYAKGFKEVMIGNKLYHYYILAILKNIYNLLFSIIFLRKEDTIKIFLSLKGKI